MLGGANANLALEPRLKERLAVEPPRAVKVDVDPAAEQLVLSGEVASGTEPTEVFQAVAALLSDQEPCLVLLRLEGLAEGLRGWAMVAWTPEASPVKLRMLCASSRRTLREEFPELGFREYNASERQEVRGGFRRP